MIGDDIRVDVEGGWVGGWVRAGRRKDESGECDPHDGPFTI